MRILRNLDLAVEIILDEGSTILKKYERLDFYLNKLANGKIYDFKAKEQVRVIEKEEQKQLRRELTRENMSLNAFTSPLANKNFKFNRGRARHELESDDDLNSIDSNESESDLIQMSKKLIDKKTR